MGLNLVCHMPETVHVWHDSISDLRFICEKFHRKPISTALGVYGYGQLQKKEEGQGICIYHTTSKMSATGTYRPTAFEPFATKYYVRCLSSLILT